MGGKDKDIKDIHDVDQLHPTCYLRASDFADRDGRPVDVTLTIHRVTKRDVHNPETHVEEEKPILHFVEMQERPEDERKMLVLNKTNERMIALVLAERNPNKWVGGRITLYQTTCQTVRNGRRQVVPCIRVREAVR